MIDQLRLLDAPCPASGAVATGRGAPARPRARLPRSAAGPLREQLRAARRAAAEGRLDIARRFCARAILRDQPLLVASLPLLQDTIATLLLCGAFGQLGRLLLALRGRTVAVSPGGLPPADGNGAGAMPDACLDPAWFTGPGAVAASRIWAERLAEARPVGRPGG